MSGHHPWPPPRRLPDGAEVRVRTPGGLRWGTVRSSFQEDDGRWWHDVRLLDGLLYRAPAVDVEAFRFNESKATASREAASHAERARRLEESRREVPDVAGLDLVEGEPVTAGGRARRRHRMRLAAGLERCSGCDACDPGCVPVRPASFDLRRRTADGTGLLRMAEEPEWCSNCGQSFQRAPFTGTPCCACL